VPAWQKQSNVSKSRLQIRIRAKPRSARRRCRAVEAMVAAQEQKRHHPRRGSRRSGHTGRMPQRTGSHLAHHQKRATRHPRPTRPWVDTLQGGRAQMLKESPVSKLCPRRAQIRTACARRPSTIDAMLLQIHTQPAPDRLCETCGGPSEWMSQSLIPGNGTEEMAREWSPWTPRCADPWCQSRRPRHRKRASADR
jgi:hypothetical protein